MKVRIPPHLLRWLAGYYREKRTATLRISLKDGHTRYYADENIHQPPQDEWADDAEPTVLKDLPAEAPRG